MLQLVDKMKIKQKELGWFVLSFVYYLARYIISRPLEIIILPLWFPPAT